MTWTHRIVDGGCANCGAVTLIYKKSKGRYVCPNSTTFTRSVPTKTKVRNARIEELGRKFNGHCDICNDPIEKPHVDHDHKTGLARGYLCFSCNVGLGHFKDSPELLAKAIEYLQ